MIEFINKSADFIASNFLLVFGIYSILYFLVRPYRKNKAELNAFDKSAIDLTIWVGTIWIALKLIGIVAFFYKLKQEPDPNMFSEHLSWFIKNSWLQLVFWVLLTQLLRFTIIKNYLIPRVLVGFFFAFSFDRIWMLLINFHRDYMPNGHNYNIPEILLGLLLKTVIFIVVISLFHIGLRLLKKVR